MNHTLMPPGLWTRSCVYLLILLTSQLTTPKMGLLIDTVSGIFEFGIYYTSVRLIMASLGLN